MKNTTLTKMERSCVLLFDEMKTQSIYDYDKKNDYNSFEVCTSYYGPRNNWELEAANFL
jgi:hypothetical protein